MFYNVEMDDRNKSKIGSVPNFDKAIAVYNWNIL